MNVNEFQYLRDLKAEINRNLRVKETKNELKHIRQQVCEYLLQRYEDISDYGSQLDDLSEIPEDSVDPEEIDLLKQTLKYSINIMLVYTIDKDIVRHLKQMHKNLS